MNRLLLCVRLFASLAPLHAAAAPSLNLVFILADDLGWSDATL